MPKADGIELYDNPIYDQIMARDGKYGKTTKGSKIMVFGNDYCFYNGFVWMFLHYLLQVRNG